MYKIAIVGLPNAGKSTLFNILTNADVLTAPYPFSTIEPNKGIVKFNDKGVELLSKATASNSQLLPEFELWDIAGLVKGASNGEGMGNEFLGYILQCDLIIHVLGRQGYESEVQTDIEIIEKELLDFDRKLLLKHYERDRRLARLYPNNKEMHMRDRVITKALDICKSYKNIKNSLNGDEVDSIADIRLLSLKPKVEIHNSFTLQLDGTQPLVDIKNVNLLDLSVFNYLDHDEIVLLGYTQPLVKQLKSLLFENFLYLLNLKRFYTYGHLGVGLWVMPKAANSKICSQLVHSSLDDEITKVKVASLTDFVCYRSWSSLSTKGLVSNFGIKYIPKDKDVLYFVIK